MANQSHSLNPLQVPLCFESMNNSCPKMYTYSPMICVTLYIVFATVIILTVMGNSLVIITVRHFKQLQTPTNYLIVSLAVADLLVGVLFMPLFMVNTVESCWYTGHLHCKINTGLGMMLGNASIMNLCFIAIDRYFAVCHPLSYRTTITPSLTVSIIFLIWSLAAIFGFCSSFLVVQNVNLQTVASHVKMCEGICFVLHSKLTGVLPIFGMCFPGAIMICVYAKIYHVAKRQASLIHDKHRCVKNLKTAKKTEIKATRTLTIVMGVFLSLWLPFNLCNLLHPLTDYSIPFPLIQALAWVGCVNSMCNPIVYAVFYSWFRKALKILIFDMFYHNSSGLNIFSD